VPGLKEPLHVDITSEGEAAVLVLRGELDPHTAPTLQRHIDSTVGADTKTLTLDVAGLLFIDSSGLRVIIAAHKDMEARGGRLVLRDPTVTTRRLLDITGLADHVVVE
jgi:anti-sigma B factor antagonist